MNFDPTAFDPRHLKRNYTYADKFQDHLANIFTHGILNETEYVVAEGFHPKYDFVTSFQGTPLPIEVKCVESQKTKSARGTFIEVAYGDGRHSALSLTESIFYLLLLPEWNTGTRVIKTRLFSVDVLRAAQIKADQLNEFVTFPSSNNSPGAIGFYFDAYKEPHIWVGDFPCYNYPLWDVTSFCRVNNWCKSHIQRHLNKRD